MSPRARAASSRRDDRKVHEPGELDSALKAVVDDILAVYDAEKVILYGSAAEGRPWHDLDLLVIAETSDRFPERLKKVALAKSYWTPADILVLTPDELDEAVAENRYFIVEEVLKKGTTVYDRPGSKRLDPVRS
ncbi:MAG TPA: nucleotidyltransferase domain-containing protein [Dehalococcoidia bacterium]|nr:nucleotidyltransferase domain-containing protein [Dehalococcoidia bacterium]